MTEDENPPIEEPIDEKKSFGWRFWLFLATVVFLLYGLTSPPTTGGRKRAEQTEAISNGRQIGLALHEFERKYGAFPNDETKTLVEKKHGTAIPLDGDSSNALFRQLFAAKILDNEAMFHAKVSGARKPDNDNSSPLKILEKNEVAFGYIAGLTSEGNPARVVAFCPIIPGTDRFDPKPFKGKAVVLRIDNSVSSVNINKDGHAIYGAGKTLFETGEGTIWGDEKPDIRYPE